MIFSRRRSAPDNAVAEFWQWWQGVRGRVEAAIGSGDWDELTSEIKTRVEAIHPDLQWEFSNGTHAQHALVVSPAGEAGLRAVSARWAASAPPPDDTWEYHASRQPDPAVFDARMGIGGAEIALADLRYGFAVVAGQQLVDVTVYHPAFPSLPDEVRAQIAFLSLDWLLGEEAVERWVGVVEFGGAPTPDARPREELQAAVERQAVEYKEPTWAVLSAQDKKGWPILATAQLPLLPVRFPRFDTHLAVMLPFREANDGGLPLDGSLQALRDFEDELTAAIGADGDLLAHETTRGVRTLHFYVDGTTSAAAVVEERLPGWREGRPSLRTAYDPGLDGVAHLRGA
jgi:hypothetical protein